MGKKTTHDNMVLETLGASPDSLYVSKHFNCTAHICNTVTLDLKNHLIWFTVIVDRRTVTRLSLTYAQYVDMSDFILDVVAPESKEEEVAKAS